MNTYLIDPLMSQSCKDAKKPNWQFTSQELLGALKTWDELSQRTGKAPDEQRLEEFKALLCKIQKDLEAFEPERVEQAGDAKSD
ncbi:MAG: hypothetical protein ACK5RO_02360 [Pseudobdellovibrionaceae bacterium]|jgi:hypothetical protein